MARSRPNILVIGTPGTGKSTICAELAEKTGLNHLVLSQVILEKKFYKEWDDEYSSAIFDEDEAGDWLEGALADGGNIVEFHSCNWMDSDWFDLIVVLRASTHILYDRLEARGYPQAKVQENVQAEIFMICKEEAFELMEDCNGHGNIIELENNEVEQVGTNVQAIIDALIQRGHN